LGQEQRHLAFMGSLFKIGRILYGISIAGTGFLTIYYRVFPYMLFPSQNFQLPGFAILVSISGALLVLAGLAIVLNRKAMDVSFLLGSAFLLIICFFHIPYELMYNPNYKHLGEWENALKDMSLAGGAYCIAGNLSGKRDKSFWTKLMPLGTILYSIPILCFSILHFQFAKDVSTMVPSWIPGPVFWTYVAGVALLGSSISMILKIRTGLIAALLGLMVFIWFVILHIPRVMVASAADLNGETVSAFLALAYSGTAFVIAGAVKEKSFKK
jgi:uncharacterized membrane protein